ncbi:MAG: DNA mismatch repair protein MutS [Salinarimonadaceae bacterium]|nr:MAG: DNA mismatch repair protein MutS [Salinarimonadaceae bacterium]
MARRRRELSPEEKRLWEHVSRQAKPLRRAPPATMIEASPATIVAPATATAAPPSKAPPRTPFLPAYRPPVSASKSAAQAGPAPAGTLERGERRALKRRARDVDAVIDLHGMRQDEAHPALIHFLRTSSALGRSIVLVVTGKGGAQGSEGAGLTGLGEGRGVLRRLTPHWLRSAELRPFVLGFEEAAAHHGGSGALYVRLRRRGR